MATEAGSEIITFERGWDEIQTKAIDKLESILDDGFKNVKGRMFGNEDYIQVYTLCYDMCTQRSPYNHSRELYQRHGETIEAYLTAKVLPALRARASQGGTILLNELQKRWANHQVMNKWMTKFFNYLDRFYVKHHSLQTLAQAGLRHFKQNIYEEIKPEATAAIIALIDEERDGNMIDKTLIKTNIELYENIGMGNLESYTNDLEQPLLDATRDYYAKKRELWIVHDSTPEYLIKAEKALQDEKDRVHDYLNPLSENKLLKVVEEEILEKAETILLEKEGSGCYVLLSNDKSDDLQRMCRLFSRLDNGLDPIAAIVKKFICDMGMEIVQQRQSRLEAGEKDKNDDPTFVKALLALHEKYLGVIKSDFSGHSIFQKALKDAFVEFVNKNVGQYKNTEFMSTYCDRILKSGGEKLSEKEVEETLEKVVQLFSYLTEKDVFAEIYRNQLAKRLLNGRSASSDAEKVMISKLKMQCGTHFTSKMEGMISDLAVGADSKGEFDEHMKSSDVKMDFSVQVLTTGFWPTYKSPEINIPDEMSKCMDIFKTWHDQRHQQRKLTWVFSLGNATVRANFGKKTYDLIVTSLQAIALNLMNGGKKKTYEELKQELNLDDSVLKPLMHSLSCGKHKVISKSPASNKINSTDSFVANAKFQSNMRKIRIPMASLDATHNAKKVDEDRNYAIEASIVRTMKARKTLKHQQLVAEVLSQLAFFKPNPRAIKKRIESLIDREYLERSADDSQLYNYLA